MPVNVRHRSVLNVWDSFSFNTKAGWFVGQGDRPYVTLFMGHNAAAHTRSNLPASASALPGETHVIMNWYARTNVPALPDEFLLFASTSTVSFNVGTRPCHQLPLSDLITRYEGLYYPVPMAAVPQRQCYDVTVTADSRALARLVEAIPVDVTSEDLVWIHLEGVRITGADEA